MSSTPKVSGKPARKACTSGVGPRRTVRAALVVASIAALIISALTLTAPHPAGAQEGPFPAFEQVLNVGADRPPLAGDFDGDGRGDLIWYNEAPETDGVWYGRADGKADAAVLGAGAGFSPFVGDFNGDTIDDVFWYEQSRSVPGIVWFGARNRQWAPVLVPAPPAQAIAVVSDLDGNGADDIFFSVAGGDDALFSALAGSFRVEAAYVADRYESFAVGDFDANGSGDILLYDRGNGFAVLWWGSPTGRSGGLIFIGTGFILRSGDFDGTGTADLLWYTPGVGPDAVLYGQRGQTFLGAPVNAGGDYEPFVGDFDGDKRDDVFWYEPEGGGDLVWFFRPTAIDGLAVVDPPTAVSSGATVSTTATTVDFDGDGDDETLFFAPGSGYATWWYGGFRALGQPAPNLIIDTMASGLDRPWDIAFTPDGAMLFTERPGRLSARLPDGTVRGVTADLADLFASGETGFMGLAVDPAFGANRRIYTCQGSTATSAGPGTGPEIKVVAWTLNGTITAATRVADPLVGGLPIVSGRHGGCRLRFDSSGALLIGTGDAATGTNPQNLDSRGGKVLRVNPADGSPAAGNPFLSSVNATTRLIYSYGHRNVQGLAVRPGSGQIFEVEHGPDRDDEVNVLVAGANYGWNPVPGYNESVPMTFAGATPARWSSGSPTVAPSGATFLVGKQWKGYDGALAVATLRGAALRLQFYDAAGNLAGETLPPLLTTLGRLRAAVQGPDGALYLTTDNGVGNDLVLRVAPA